MPERDIESLGVIGKGAGGGQEILPPPPPSSPTESGCLVILVCTRFLTHNMRDLDALLPGNCSQSRCGSFSPARRGPWARALGLGPK